MRTVGRVVGRMLRWLGFGRHYAMLRTRNVNVWVSGRLTGTGGLIFC